MLHLAVHHFHTGWCDTGTPAGAAVAHQLVRHRYTRRCDTGTPPGATLAQQLGRHWHSSWCDTGTPDAATLAHQVMQHRHTMWCDSGTKGGATQAHHLVRHWQTCWCDTIASHISLVRVGAIGRSGHTSPLSPVVVVAASGVPQSHTREWNMLWGNAERDPQSRASHNMNPTLFTPHFTFAIDLRRSPDERRRHRRRRRRRVGHCS
jgi:hypothetical protein